MKLSEFASGITIESESVPENPNISDPSWKANHWKCTLRRDGKRMTVYFSMGTGIVGEPSVSDVLESLSLDSEALGMVFEEWAREFGYDVDSIKASRVFHACRSAAMKCLKFFGKDFDAFLTAERE